MKYLVFLLGLLLLASCTEEVVQKPENLLSENEMVAIYFDVSLINAARNSGYDKFKEHGIDSREYLYEKHGIDSLRLAASAVYYAAKPLVHERIYARVEEKLDSLKSHLESQLNELNDQRDKRNTGVDSMELRKKTEEPR